MHKQGMKNMMKMDPNFAGMMRAMGIEMEADDPDDPKTRADDIAYEGVDSPDPDVKISKGFEALTIDDSNVYAYTVICNGYWDKADETRGDVRCKHLKDALKYANKAITSCENNNPSFLTSKEIIWSDIDNRPYLRVLHMKAQILERQGKLDQACQIAQRIYKVNPNDNQGVRNLLVPWYVRLGQYDEAKKILKQYADTMCTVLAWSKVLLDYILKDNPLESLKKALKANVMVPKYLLFQHKIPDKLPCGGLEVGGLDEAIYYAHAQRDGWLQTPGALDWLQDCRLSVIPRRCELIDALSKHSLLLIYRNVTDKSVVNEILCTRNPPTPKEKLEENMKILRDPCKKGPIKAYDLDRTTIRKSSELLRKQGGWRGAACSQTIFMMPGGRDNAGWKTFHYDCILEVPFFELITSSPCDCCCNE